MSTKKKGQPSESATQPAIATQTSAPPALGTRIRLDDDDIRTGFELEIEATRLNAKLDLIREMALGHKDQMRDKYGAGDEYRLDDWLTGFVYTGRHNGE